MGVGRAGFFQKRTESGANGIPTCTQVGPRRHSLPLMFYQRTRVGALVGGLAGFRFGFGCGLVNLFLGVRHGDAGQEHSKLV